MGALWCERSRARALSLSLFSLVLARQPLRKGERLVRFDVNVLSLSLSLSLCLPLSLSPFLSLSLSRSLSLSLSIAAKGERLVRLGVNAPLGKGES